MGLYTRTSVKVGPLRFNLSKSGLSVSAGVKGLRLGTGPRGNFVHMGLKGVHYRTTLPPTPRTTPKKLPVEHPPDRPTTHDPLEEIESADASQIVSSSSQDLLNELNGKQRKMRSLPLVTFIAVVVVLAALISSLPVWAVASAGIAGIAGIYLAHQRDILAKTAVLFYSLDPEMERAYRCLHSQAEQLANCQRAWHIEAHGQVRDRKYHAGATNLVRRKRTSIRKAPPPFVKTNVETVALGVGRQTLYFFPDRVLVYDTSGVGAVSYAELDLSVEQSRFIEDEAVPKDARVVDHTWQYVNKKGGPDRRFKDNRKLPVCLYEEIYVRSHTGLNELIQVSQCGLAVRFANAISSLASRIPSESAAAEA